MSRTYRKVPYSCCCLRRIKTKNEKTILNGLIADLRREDFGLNQKLIFGKHNRLFKYVPDSWDDFVASSAYQMDFGRV